MLRHWRYLKHVLRHKWYVLVAGLALDVPLWRLLLHDWTKFTPGEWREYVRFFEQESAEHRRRHFVDPANGDLAFLVAFNQHNKANDHHWEYWVQVLAGGNIVVHEMSETARLEMLADWLALAAATQAPAWEWWEKNQNRLLLGKHTRRVIERFFMERRPQS